MNGELEKNIPNPTKAELGILAVLWRMGASTVREVHETMSERQTTGYTTVLKLLQIMHQKGLVTRDDSRRAHVYKPVMSKESVQRDLTADLVTRAFEGSRSQLVLQALGDSESATPEELAQIRELLSRIERRG